MYPDNYMNPMNNPMQMLQVFNQIRAMQNPQQGMERMFGNNPVFQQARKMAEGKSPEQMKETVLNLAKTQGVDIQQIMGMLNQFGIKI